MLWYVFGIHHITRPEEWPVMAVDTVSFWLKPIGFFDRNPALDVPPTTATADGGDPNEPGAARTSSTGAQVAAAGGETPT